LRERYFSEQIAHLVWKIPFLDPEKKFDFEEFVTHRESGELIRLEQEVLQKLQTLASKQNTRDAPGFRGPMVGFVGKLVSEDGKVYECTVATDVQRLEVVVVDSPKDYENEPIRKYRRFSGKFEIKGKMTISDLSCLYDKPFSWRRNFSDNDRPEKSLTLKESCRFMEEILRARQEFSHSSPYAVLLK